MSRISILFVILGLLSCRTESQVNLSDETQKKATVKPSVDLKNLPDASHYAMHHAYKFAVNSAAFARLDLKENYLKVQRIVELNITPKSEQYLVGVISQGSQESIKTVMLVSVKPKEQGGTLVSPVEFASPAQRNTYNSGLKSSDKKGITQGTDDKQSAGGGLGLPDK